MRNSDLIAELQRLDPELEVFYPYSEDRTRDLRQVEELDLCLNGVKDWRPCYVEDCHNPKIKGIMLF
jgi:hypothetical protein